MGQANESSNHTIDLSMSVRTGMTRRELPLLDKARVYLQFFIKKKTNIIIYLTTRKQRKLSVAITGII